MEMGENSVLTFERSLPWGQEKSKMRKTKSLPQDAQPLVERNKKAGVTEHKTLGPMRQPKYTQAL